MWPLCCNKLALSSQEITSILRTSMVFPLPVCLPAPQEPWILCVPYLELQSQGHLRYAHHMEKEEEEGLRRWLND